MQQSRQRPPWLASDSEASSLWHERQLHVEKQRRFVAAYREADKKLPDWAKAGPRLIDHEGLCGEESAWPLDPEVLPPDHPGVWRLVRPSIYEVKEQFESFVRTTRPEFAGYESLRAKARATMRKRIRKIVARLRERDRLYDESGLHSLDGQITAECDCIFDIEQTLESLDPSPAKFAAQLLAQVDSECSRDAFAWGDGYCSIMAVATTALEALLPSLSTGLIRDHAAFFVANPYTPLAEMPFTSY
ncbi:hypothetical protein QA640_24080 [Bradyrhizobium sp. CB82]|uniref:hypothetical protein n=1 Tax=Bradyrhizobium sp. CB82 TaxID=3039159 RepID=UPI0024B16EFA|nr:hypothetical protein [Bradyrhizobium sp. CB82]WFU37555.1 hypothetical protein QA640_24080 [Bradyrhizobium sp. CB82]